MISNLHIGFDARHLTSKVLRGMDRYTVGLISELVNQGVQVTLFHRACEPLNSIHIKNLKCNIIGLKDYNGLHWEQVVLPLALLRGKFDLFHAPAERGVPLFAPCPVVFTIHSVTGNSYYNLVQSGLLPGCVSDYLGYDFNPSSNSFWDYLFRLQLLRANYIITPSDFCRSEVIRFLNVNPNRVITTHLAAHEQFEKPARPKDERDTLLKTLGIKKPYLLYVGGYEPHKNVAGLLETFAIVKQTHPDLMLVIAGSKFLPESLRQKALALNLHTDDVLFLVDVTDELTDLYDSAELFVTLSWRETFCLPALEAMKRGVPVIGSQWGAFSEVAGDAGQVINPNDYTGAASTILQMLNPEKRMSLSDLACQQARKFNWERTGKETLNIYKSLLGLTDKHS
jgi:glycosyltransferase involved in cell wall biosynthesis